MTRRIALFGGSFNPAGLHHYAIAEALTKRFDQVIIVPCGPRSDKETTNDTLPVDRATMVDLTFGNLKGCVVDLSDMERDAFTTTWDLWQRYTNTEEEVWLVVGADLVRGLRTSDIYQKWDHGPQLWQTARFVIVPDQQGEIPLAQRPPHSMMLEYSYPQSVRSTFIRQRIAMGEAFQSYVTKPVAEYINRYRLYRRTQAQRVGSFVMPPDTPVFAVVDETNARAVAMAVESAKAFHIAGPSEPAQAIVSIGGDGTMLQAIRQHWRQRLPFIGLNLGHRGFLLNEHIDRAHPLTVYHSPLLFVIATLATGQVVQDVAFNDAWVQCQLGTTGWMSVAVNGEQKIPRLIGDGFLVATAAGSTGYARSMGASPIIVGTPSLVVTGSNVSEPAGWRTAQLSLHSRITIRTYDNTSPRKRPLFGFVDGQPLGEVEAMEVRASRVAAAELAFSAGHDLAGKVAALQFPSSQ